MRCEICGRELPLRVCEKLNEERKNEMRKVRT
jgi:hypothetical protein